MQSAIVVENLVKRYPAYIPGRPQKTAIDGFDLSVPTGGVTGLLGPNGSGKTTVIRTLLGLSRPTSGSAIVLGRDAWRESLAIRKEVAYVPAERTVFDWMPVKTFIAGAARLSIRWDKEFCERLLAMWEIDEQSALGKLSSGSRSKVLLITALARRTPLVILDEPTTSLDPAATDEALAELVGIAAEGTTLLVVTHQIEVANRICDRITIMDRGRAVMDADVDELKSSWATIDFSGTALAGTIEKWEEVKKVTTYDQFTRALVRSSPAAVAERARMMGAEVIAVQPLTLREVYLAITNRADDEKEIADDTEDHLA